MIEFNDDNFSLIQDVLKRDLEKDIKLSAVLQLSSTELQVLATLYQDILNG